MQHLKGFASLAERFDGFIIDLWGVVHDGVTPYPGAIDCLRRLRAAGKRTVLLSNAPRRAHVAAEAMRGMGIGADLYGDIVTSGEVTHLLLRSRSDAFFAALGRRVYHLGPERDRNVIEGLDVELTSRPAAASFVLNTGPDDTRSPTDIGEYEAELRECVASGLPMVCANPDLEVIRGGERIICAGLLTQRYEQLGGRARWIGKPDPAVYGPVLEQLGVENSRVLALGDTLRTDIAGAAAVNVASCWVLGGIHGEELGLGMASPAEVAAAAESAATAAGLAPYATIPAFQW
jgi:HAD superfamily hydrolase (TIGR01459 family)